MSARRPRTGGFAASLSASRYKSVSDKFKQRPSSAGHEVFGAADQTVPMATLAATWIVMRT